MFFFLKSILKNKLKKLEENIVNHLYSRIEEDPNFAFNAALIFTFILTILILQLLFG